MSKFLIAGTPPQSPPWGKVVLAILCGWAVPGLGHMVTGRVRQGALLLLLVGGCFLLGLCLSDFEAVSRDLHPYAFYGEIGIGAGTLALLSIDPARDLILEGKISTSTYATVPSHADAGVLFCVIAGLLNVLVVLDIGERLLGGPVRRERKAKTK